MRSFGLLVVLVLATSVTALQPRESLSTRRELREVWTPLGGGSGHIAR